MGITESTETIHRETFYWSTVLLPFSSVRRYSEFNYIFMCRAVTVCSFVFSVCFPAQQQCSEVAFWRVSLKNLLIKWLLNFADAAPGGKKDSGVVFLVVQVVSWYSEIVVQGFQISLRRSTENFCKQVLPFYKRSQKIAQRFESSCVCVCVCGGGTININDIMVWNAYTEFHTFVFLLVLLFYCFTWYTWPPDNHKKSWQPEVGVA